jgi:VanZ family protein
MVGRSSSLARYLFAAYVVLIAYASLHPLTGWRDLGLSPLAFIAAPWPKYYTGFDIGANVLGYIPLGALAVLALRPLRRGTTAIALATCAGIILSMALEALQAYLPDRIPSNLDVLSNGAGTLIGAIVGNALAPRLLEDAAITQLRDRVVVPGPRADLGLVLVGLWLFTQLNPETLLFGTGDLRSVLGLMPSVLHPAQTFIRIEAAVAMTNLVAAALLAGLILAPDTARRGAVLALIVAALAVRTVAFAILFEPADAFEWATPGALTGLAIGTGIALLVLALPRGAAATLAGLLLMAATALVNIAPENPYLAHTLAAWPQGHFLNFNGLTRLVSLAWPFAALVYVMLPAGPRATPASPA